TERAVERYREGLELARPWKTDTREILALQLANELLNLSQYEEAIRTLDWLGSFRDQYVVPWTGSNAEALLQRALFRFGDLPAAERELNRARSRPRSAQASPSAFSLHAEATLRLELGQLSSASELYSEAVAQARREQSRIYESAALEGLAEVAQRQGDWSKARRLVVEARAVGGELGAESERDLAIVDGISARELGDLAGARIQLERAPQLAPSPMSSWRIQLELGRLYQRIGDPAAAQAAFERSIADIESQRRRLERDALRDWLMDSRRAPYEALFALHAENGRADEALRVLERFLSYRLVEGVAATSKPAIDRPLDALERRAAMVDLARAENGVAGSSVPHPKGAAIAFVVTPNRVWRLTVVEGRTSVSGLAVPPSELCADLRRFTESPDDDQLAGRLGAELLPGELLARLGARFAIVAPLCASGFPVGALLVDGHRLIERRVVTLSPSISTAVGADLPGSSGGALVLGDPVGDLPAAREEAGQVAALLGRSPWVGPEASRQRLLEARSVGLLHLATHATVQPTGPVLVLADGPLTVADIVRLAPAPRVVVLASCRSGARGESSAPETLAAAFLRAGSRAVLATLKSVEDRFAARVVQRFYEVGGAEDPARALADVQRELSRTEPASRWAAFYVAGKAEPLGEARALARRPTAQK
ncbi:MAG TPA: CHAT domain-containing protein, partial [Myxococcaceae bacterium]|nr:CHAT domain-containing protein [Myxococcaceae bacterium]